MVGPLLETKLYVHSGRPGLVARPRLNARLDQAVQARLTLVSAPAGFGKTTSLAAWLDSAKETRSVAWLSLDPSDDDPVTFWTYVIAALQTALPGVAANALALLQALQPPPTESLLTALLNDLARVSNEIVLVLDDYHVINTPAVHAGIAFLVDHLPPRLHVVIATRADPVLPLARWRARGQLAELRAADLRFTPAEAADYLNNSMGLELAADAVETLEIRTEGWIAALQLAALSMQGREDAAAFIATFAGDHRYVVDYLAEEVLQRQPEAVRKFLHQTSILEQLSGPLCDAVTGQADGQALLEELDRSNLFVVALDGRRQWYRYHHLFADVLRTHLRGQQPEQMRVLHRRASEWYERNGDAPQAIQHALAAREFERVATLVELSARAILRSYRPSRLVQWVQLAPDDSVRARPVLCAYYAFALFGLGELDAAETWLRHAESALESAGRCVADQQELRSVPGIIALGWAYRAQATGDVAATLERAGQALKLMPESDHVWRAGAAVLMALAHWHAGDLETAQRAHDAGVVSLEQAGDMRLALSAACDGAILRRARGRLAEAMRTYERWLQVAQETGFADGPGVADVHFGIAELLYERNDLPAARWHLLRGDEMASRAALPQTPARQALAWAQLRRVDGDLDQALELLDRAERVSLRNPVPDVRPASALKVRIWLMAGRTEEALNWVRTHRLAADDELEYRLEFEHITLARVLIAQSDDAATRLLDRLLIEAEAHGRTGSVIDMLILQSLARRAHGHAAPALVPLQRALTLAEPEEYVRTFVDEGEPIRDLLRRAVAAGISTAYARRLLSAFDEPISSAIDTAAATLVRPLTGRELEILRLVAVGMRNQEIAEQLVVSLPTVKRHIANAYDKLGVANRTEAVARAAALGLL
jgi:LuxR family maltose regulon positive regulatory protein